MRDIRDAVRTFTSSPVLTVSAVLSLALGIGATTAIFSLLNGLLLKPLPVRDPQTLVKAVSGAGGEAIDVPVSVWTTARQRGAFGGCFAWSDDRVDLAQHGASEFASAVWATGNMFDVLGVGAEIGRVFGPGDDHAAGGPNGRVAVISDAFWRSRYGASRGAIGSVLTIERVPFRIVGVLPRGFFGMAVGRSFDVLLPLETRSALGRAFEPYVEVMGRLAKGQTAASLTTVWRTVQPAVRQATMPHFQRAEDRDAYLRDPWTAEPAPAGVSSLRATYVPALDVLFAAALVIVLIACGNVAMLMLGRAAARRFEFAVRLALGASRGRIARLLAVESALISIAGTALGFAFARWSGPLIVSQLNTWFSATAVDLSPDWRVFSAAAVAALGTALLFGTAPAIHAARVPAATALASSPSRGGSRFAAGDALVIGQLALSTVLIVASGLFVRSFVRLAYRDLGFDRDRVGIAVVDLRHSPTGPAERLAFFDALRDAAAAVPGVEAAAVSMATPIGPSGIRMMSTLEIAREKGAAPVTARLLLTPVSPGWFRVYGTRLLAGRDFDRRDVPGGASVAIVNRAFARKYVGGENPIGHTIVERAHDGGRSSLTIVGMVEDAAFASVRAPLDAVLYKPLAQVLAPNPVLARLPNISVSLRRAPGAPVQPVDAAVADAIGRIDPEGSLTFQHLDAQLDAFYVRERLLAMVAGFFGVLGLVLAGVGLYGVTSYGVSRRHREIGIRMALGADGASVRRMVLRRLTVLSAVGFAAGALLSVWLARTIASLLYGIQPHDSFAFATGLAVLAATTCVAAWLPVRRASRLDPAVVLRES